MAENMYRVMKEIRWEAGHRLLNYPHHCKYVHGHSYLAEIHLVAPALDDMGFVEDFTIIKEKVKKWIDEAWDHGFKLHRDDTQMLEFLTATEQKLFLFDENPTAENISKKLFHVTEELLNTVRITVEKVTVWETKTSSATFGRWVDSS